MITHALCPSRGLKEGWSWAMGLATGWRCELQRWILEDMAQASAPRRHLVCIPHLPLWGSQERPQ